MSKVKQLFMAAVLAMPLLVAVPVSAVENNCSVSGTGQGSNNQCTNTSNYRCEVKNNTVVISDTSGNQVAQSGNATGSNNNGSGNATSGSVTNSNGTTFDFAVNNSNACTVAKVTVPVKPAPQATTPKGAAAKPQGMGSAQGTQAQPTVLANTSANTMAPFVMVLLAAGALAVLGVGSYAAFANRR